MTNIYKQENKEIEARLWQIFSKFIRRRDCLRTTGNIFWGLCFTCDKRQNFKQLEAGHFLPGRSNGILYDEKGVHAQCKECNQYKHGNQHIYRERMILLYGIKVVEEIEKNKDKVFKFTKEELIEMFLTYKSRFNKLMSIKPEIKPGSYDYEIEKNLDKLRVWEYK